MSNETARRIPAPDSSAILETPSDVELFTPPPGVRTSTSKPSVADGIVSNVLACVDVNNVSASGVEVDDDGDDVTDEAGNKSNPGSAVDVDVEDECRILSVIWGPSFKLASSVEVDDVDDEDDEELDDDKTVDGDDDRCIGVSDVFPVGISRIFRTSIVMSSAAFASVRKCAELLHVSARNNIEILYVTLLIHSMDMRLLFFPRRIIIIVLSGDKRSLIHRRK